MSWEKLLILTALQEGGDMSQTKKSFASRLFTWPKFIILLLLLGLGVMGLWIYMRDTILRGLNESINNLKAQGYQISYENIVIDGFPIQLNARTKDIIVKTPDNRNHINITNTPDNWLNSWAVKTDNLSFSSLTFTPLSWEIHHRGNLGIDMRGTQGERYMFDLNPAHINGKITANLKGLLKSVSLTMGETQIDSLIGTPPFISKIDGVKFDLRSHGKNANLKLDSENILLSPATKGVLDNVLGRSITHANISFDISDFETLQQNGFAVWQENGGTLQNGKWDLLWGDADIIGEFNLSYKNGLPQGHIKLKIKKPVNLIDKIASVGIIESQHKDLASGFLKRIKTDEDGRKQIDLSLNDGKLSYGFLTLYEF